MRGIVVDVLEQKIVSGRFSEDEAIDISRMILRDNLRSLMSKK
jgi:hypothetical protein